MNETIINIVLNAFFITGAAFTTIFLALMCADEFRKGAR